jgi:hypothetical protein
MYFSYVGPAIVLKIRHHLCHALNTDTDWQLKLYMVI